MCILNLGQRELTLKEMSILPTAMEHTGSSFMTNNYQNDVLRNFFSLQKLAHIHIMYACMLTNNFIIDLWLNLSLPYPVYCLNLNPIKRIGFDPLP